MSRTNRLLDRMQGATDTLKEVVFYYFVLVLLAAVLFSLVEGVGFWDALYWGGATTTTTGYGDISPKTGWGRAIALFAMHVSIFLISPLVIARVINYVNRDTHQFTHEEQQDLVDRLERIERLLRDLEARSGQQVTDEGRSRP